MHNPFTFRFSTAMLRAGLLILIGCSSDESHPADIRDGSIGTYRYEIKHSIFDGTSLVYQPGEEDTGTFVLSKNENGIELKDSDILIFKAENCIAGLDGYYFNIPSQQLGYGNALIIITGFEGNDLNGEKYEGVYDHGTGQLTAYFSTKERFTDRLRVFKLVGTKGQ